jgi:hypothetical protein
VREGWLSLRPNAHVRMGVKLSLPPAPSVEDDGKNAEIESLRKKLAEAMRETERERSEKERERSEKERERSEKERERSEKERERCEKELIALMGQVSTLSIGKFTIDIPSDVEISRDSLSKMSHCVADYNGKATSTERSGSIRDPNSVHYLWCQIFEEILITSVGMREPENQTRVVYEWEIFDPRSGDRKYIDFAFTEGTCAHLNWLRYRGGLELKVNPRPLSDGSNMASGTVNTLGQKQALSRSASCIFACIAASDWVAPPGGFQVCTCYADARFLAVARVSVDAAMVVTADIIEPIALPGYLNTTETTALRIMKHFLTSPVDKLSGLVCLKQSLHMPTVKGLVADSGKEEEWELGAILGVGGFAVVYVGEEAGGGGLGTVIKLPSIHQNKPKLLKERLILDKLNTSLSGDIKMCIPKCVSSLERVSALNREVIALRLQPVGVPVPRYLRLMEQTADIFTQLVRLLGPALVRVLRAVHGKGIIHRDVRPTNLLIVPPPDVVAAIVRAGGDILKAPNAMKSINLDDCSFVLNDWGEAKDRAGGDGKANDLKALVAALGNPFNLLDFSRVSTVKRSPAEHAGSESSRLPFMTPELAAKLHDLANICQYDELETRLLSATFETPV